MAPLSDEENNYIRLALLLIGVSPRAVRTFFDKEFHPSNLHSTLNKNKPILHDLRLKKTLNSYQWNLLFPKNGLTNSSNFDVTMMICLIRNLTPVTPPLTGFDSLPTQAETSPESDLARIKCYRNILAHLNSDTIDTVFFNTAWGDITEAVGRLSGQRMKHECQELKVKILDQSNQELMNEIKQSQREIRELQDIIKRLLNKVRRNCLSALDILGGQIKKQSNQEITIQIKKAEREIRELEDIMERLHNKLWRCQSGADIIDLTGDGVNDERGNTQILIDQTKDDYSKTRKRKRNNTGEENEAIRRITEYSNNRNEKMEHRGFTDSGPFQTMPRDSLDSTGEENEATRRITGYSKNWDEIMERRYFTDSGPFQTMPGDSLDSVQAEIETTSQNTMPTNHQNEEGGNMDSGVQNIQEDSWDSIFTTDIPSSGFMLRSGIHVPTNRYDFPNFTDRRDIQSFQQQTNQEKTPFCKKKYLSMLRFLVLMIVLGGIAGGLTKIIHDKYFAGSNDTPTIIIDDLPDFPDKCENDVSTVTVGEQMCIPYTQKFTSSPSVISVKQLSSQYLSALQGFSVNVSSDTFMQRNGDWIVNFNSSRPDQQLRFMMGKATCDSIGKYESSIEYDDGNVTTNKFEVSLKDPQLQHSVTRINDNIHIHCEMIKTCMASSLVLFVNDGGSSRMIPNINVCSNNDQQSGTTVSVDAIIGASWFSGNTTISCVPLITDSGLAANLTSTTRIPV